MIWSVHRLIRAGLAVGLAVVFVGIAVHVAHHATDLGKSSQCPVLAAAQQLPWSPAETPELWIPLVVAVGLVTVPAEPRRLIRFPEIDRSRAPPFPLA
jgi:hypothetical protein